MLCLRFAVHCFMFPPVPTKVDILRKKKVLRVSNFLPDSSSRDAGTSGRNEIDAAFGSARQPRASVCTHTCLIASSTQALGAGMLHLRELQVLR